MKILAAIDLSTRGHEWLAEQALAFGKAYDGVVDLLFVGDDPKANGALRDLLERGPEAQRGATLVRQGKVLDTILQTAERYDVLVVGPRAHGALERYVLGTMAVRTIRQAPCSVFVPRLERKRPLTERPRMVVGIDLKGTNPGWLIGKAAVWAQRVDGRLDAVFADPHGLPYIGDATIREAAKAQWLKTHEPDRQRMETLLEVAAHPNRGRCKIAEGEPESVLVAMSADYDLVLVGTRERGGLAKYVLGSVAEHVVLNSECDVLTLPSAALDTA